MPAYLERLIPDERALITATLVELVEAGCDLVLTTGGKGGRDKPNMRQYTHTLNINTMGRAIIKKVSL
ncbi:molybdenum cofactor synthesis domain-containing protein [Alcaligenes faecalis subsp. faecalis NCIB 8687]|nr:molybdenum cofactor synthesis domain-containing protein [Alcaligenes faecalis subsp. faecalis NCIB 8687]